MHRQDVGMLQAGGGFDFALKALGTECLSRGAAP
jgi:hypothetical protein